GFKTTVWMAGRDSVTPCHMDVVHNFFFQLTGEKHFLFFSPEEARKLYVYPFLHTAAKQCRLPLGGYRRGSGGEGGGGVGGGGGGGGGGGWFVDPPRTDPAFYHTSASIPAAEFYPHPYPSSSSTS